jgi:branched-chain amino acid transport system ATP-binding protein
MALLEIAELASGYGAGAVIHDITIFLDAGEIVTLVGSNGAGKSTLVKSISGLVKPLRGELYFDGEAIGRLSPAERLRRGIAHVPEGRQIFSGMTVAENLDLGAYLQDIPKDPNRFDDVCDLFPVLGSRLRDMAGNLSGGQQQMLAIARGLMSKPKFLLLDEPSLGIAPILVAEIFRLILRLRNKGITVLLAEQNARQALSIANRGYVIENGGLTMAGEARELLASPDIAERYLGVDAGADVSIPESARIAERLRICLADDLSQNEPKATAG